MRVYYFLLGILTFAQSLSGQIITTMAGSGTNEWGFKGDGGLAVFARFNLPTGMAFDEIGNLYIADKGNQRIRKIDRYGYISTYAGKGIAGRAGDGSAATAAKLNMPIYLAVDGKGNVYCADRENNVIRKITPDGIIHNFAGNGVGGFSGDNALAVNAELRFPAAVAVDKSGNVYIADWGNNRMRVVDTNGIINTVAGNGNKGNSQNNVMATASSLEEPRGLACDKDGNVIIATGNSIRKYNPITGIISLIAGSDFGGNSGDGGMAINSRFSWPTGVAIDKWGNIFIADYNNNRVRMIDTTGKLNTVAGRGVGAALGDGGDADAAGIFHPSGVATDGKGNLYISDGDNNIRFVYMGELSGAPISVFPNPCKEQCTVMLESKYEEIATLFIMDVAGQLVNTVVAPTNRPIRITLPVPGVYMLSGTSRHANWVSRVISHHD